MSQQKPPTPGELFVAGCSMTFVLPLLFLVVVMIVAFFQWMFS
jgi:hypothetical protein